MSDVRCPKCDAKNGDYLKGSVRLKCRRCNELFQAVSAEASRPPLVLTVPVGSHATSS